MFVCEFRGRSSAEGGKNVKPGKNSIFLKNCKMVILVENWKNLCISDDETDFTFEFVSRILVTPLNFVGFQGSQNFTFFETSSVE